MPAANDASGRSDDHVEGGAPLSHIDEQGEARMVDVGGKSATHRRAVAVGRDRRAGADALATRSRWRRLVVGGRAG